VESYFAALLAVLVVKWVQVVQAQALVALVEQLPITFLRELVLEEETEAQVTRIQDRLTEAVVAAEVPERAPMVEMVVYLPQERVVPLVAVQEEQVFQPHQTVARMEIQESHLVAEAVGQPFTIREHVQELREQEVK
jgi:hypothetical protein